MRVTYAAFFFLITISGVSAEQSPIRLSCNLSETQTTYSGRFSGGQISGWKGQSSKSFTEIVEIDLVANAWSNPDEAYAKGPLTSVTDQEFVLLNYDISNHFNNWRIDRFSGLYTHESRNYDPDKGETVVSKTTGTCHKLSGVRQF
jgi:hypothetical protein